MVTNTEEMRGLEAITQVVTELEPSGFLEYYRDDFLLYDAAVLRDFKGAFLWSIRPTGTHLLLHTEDTAGNLLRLKWDKAWQDVVSGSESRSYYFDGSSLVEITGKVDLVRNIIFDWDDGQDFNVDF